MLWGQRWGLSIRNNMEWSIETMDFVGTLEGSEVNKEIRFILVNRPTWKSFTCHHYFILPLFRDKFESRHYWMLLFINTSALGEFLGKCPALPIQSSSNCFWIICEVYFWQTSEVIVIKPTLIIIGNIGNHWVEPVVDDDNCNTRMVNLKLGTFENTCNKAQPVKEVWAPITCKRRELNRRINNGVDVATES